MKKAAFVFLVGAFIIVIPAFAQNYMSSNLHSFSSVSSSHYLSADADVFRMSANQSK